MEGLMDGFRQFRRVLHQPVVFRAGAGDAHGIGFLKAVGADHEGGHLAGEDDQRDGIHQRVHKARHGIGRPGARGHQNHAGLAGRPRIAFGHMDCALFVADEDVADVVLLEDLVIDRQHRPAGIAEDDIDPLILEGLNHHPCAGHLFRHLPSPFRGAFRPVITSTAQEKAPGFPSGGAWEPYGKRHRPMRHRPTTARLPDIAHLLVDGADTRAGVWGRQPQKRA